MPKYNWTKDIEKELVPREKEILRRLYQFRILSKNQIERLVYRSPDGGKIQTVTAWRHLKRLQSFRLDNRRSPISLIEQDKGNRLFWLSRIGVHLVHAMEEINSTIPLLSRPQEVHVAETMIPHQVAVNELYVKLSESLLAHKWEFQDARTLRRNWWPECRGVSVTPDGLLSVNNSDTAFFIEVDRGTERASSLKGKFRRYGEFVKRCRRTGYPGPFTKTVILFFCKEKAHNSYGRAGESRPEFISKLSLNTPGFSEYLTVDVDVMTGTMSDMTRRLIEYLIPTCCGSASSNAVRLGNLLSAETGGEFCESPLPSPLTEVQPVGMIRFSDHQQEVDEIYVDSLLEGSMAAVDRLRSYGYEMDLRKAKGIRSVVAVISRDELSIRRVMEQLITISVDWSEYRFFTRDRMKDGVQLEWATWNQGDKSFCWSVVPWELCRIADRSEEH